LFDRIEVGAIPSQGGFVESLAKPGGNITGFMNIEYAMSGKWLELLKEIAPSLSRVAVLRDLANRSGLAQLGALQSVASMFRVELVPIGMRDLAEIKQEISAFARAGSGGSKAVDLAQGVSCSATIWMRTARQSG
jgi:putative ABC transport system substrate-binding protein